MTATKVKPTETIGDDLPILTFQVNRIMKNCQYQVDIKNEWVQWVTADVNRTSLCRSRRLLRARPRRSSRGRRAARDPSSNETWRPTRHGVRRM